MVKQKGICEECKSEYEYEYNPKYPRKYCPVCSAKKKAEYEMAQTDAKAEVVKPGITQPQASVGVIGATEGIHKVMHEYQNQYEFGPARIATQLNTELSMSLRKQLEF